jgi:2'-5' RNA ligase
MEDNDGPRKKRRANRPGFNSYLKVLLDDRTMDTLHRMALEIQSRLIQGSKAEEREGGEIGKQPAQDSSRSPDQKDSKKTLRFKPRSRQSLHMTLFFGGETICELPPNELSEWHRRLSRRLAQSGFCLNDHNPKEIDVFGNYSLRVDGLKVFPPQRNNLIVATLELAPLWHLLHDDIRKIAQDESCSEALAEVTAYSKNKWIAHVTLGNVNGGPKSKINSLHTLLGEVFEKHAPSEIIEAGSDPVGIAMGGPMPDQVDLDWEYRYLAATAEGANKQLNSGQDQTKAADSRPNDNVSERCLGALTPSSAYADAFMKAMTYQYDPGARPDGFISLCVAENKLSIDLLTSKLTGTQTARAAFSHPEVYCYNTFSGLPSARQAAATFIAKRFLYRDDPSISKDQALSSIDPSHIGIGSGAAGILHTLFYLLGNNGDCCLIPAPYYAAFENQMSVRDLKPRLSSVSSTVTRLTFDACFRS